MEAIKSPQEVFGEQSVRFKDKSGMTFNYLYVNGLIGRAKNGGAVYSCTCSLCGSVVSISGGNLTRAISCGCYRSNMIDSERKTKVCSSCNLEKPISEFANNKSRKDGKSQFCIVCKLDIDRDYAGSDKRKEYAKNWQSIKRNTDISYKIRQNLSRRLNYAIFSGGKGESVLQYIGCSLDKLCEHLESQFDDNMSWDNYGSYWHIDHIKPCSLFDLSDIHQRCECFHYSNLQPLEKLENIKKSNKYYG